MAASGSERSLDSDGEFRDGVILKSRVFTSGTRNLACAETALVQPGPLFGFTEGIARKGPSIRGLKVNF
jgi:hypothetical protein